jgi:hypothetical protein
MIVATEQHIDEDVFGILHCLFCGNQTFVETRYDGVHCAGCGASVRVQRWRSGLYAMFGEDAAEFMPPDGDLRHPPDDMVFVEIKETDSGYEIGDMDCLSESDDEPWQPKPPTEFVRENQGGSSTPYMRWDEDYKPE